MAKVDPQKIVADIVVDTDACRIIRRAVSGRCADCSMFDKGQCPQERIADTCVREEAAKYAIARNRSVDTLTNVMTKHSMEKISTQKELTEFLDGNIRWTELVNELSEVLEPGASLEAPQISWTDVDEDEEEARETEPEAPKLPQEEQDLMARLRLKIKANYVQHKTVLRDFLEYCKEQGFELRTSTGMQVVSDEQHILNFTGEAEGILKHGR